MKVGSPAIRKLMIYIKQHAIPEYLRTIGVPEGGVPDFFIQAWAAVSERSNDTHVPHVHFSDGNALCSGVFYAQAPEGSGPLRFSDTRRTPCSEEYTEVPDEFFPGASYDYIPHTGDLLLFPPWAEHEVRPSLGIEPGRARIVWAFNAVVLTGTADSGPPVVLTRDLHDLKIPISPN